MALSHTGITTSTIRINNARDGTFYGQVESTDATRRTLIPDKVSGEFVVLPGGTRFRKATDYSRFDFQVHLGNQQSTAGYWYAIDKPIVSESSDGGYTTGKTFIDFSANGTFSSPLGGFNSNYYPQIPQGMRNEAVTKALLKLADQKVNLGENLATLGQTVRLFAGVTGTLAKSLSAAYRDKSLRPYLTRSVAQLRRDGVSRVIAGKYLEYVYGWKPLMQDAWSLLEVIKHGLGNTLVLHAEGKSKQQSRNKEVVYYNVSDKTVTRQLYVDERVRVNCHLWARLDPDWQGARALNQLGLLNPISLAWELMPWSFVVDWVLPIGSVMSALSAPAGLIFIDGSVAARSSAAGPFETMCWWPLGSQPDWSGAWADGSCSYEGYTRQHLTGWPLPGFWVDPDPLRGDRPFKALALLIANLGGMRKSTIG